MDQKSLHPVDYLRKRIEYDPATGRCVWLPVDPNLVGSVKSARIINVKYAGKDAGSHVNAWGYRVIGVGKMCYLLHRVVWAIHHGTWPERVIDHINGNKLDNRLANLREVDACESQRNRPTQCNNTSGVQGVTRKGKAWVARIDVNGLRLCLGSFGDFADAVNARKAAERLYGFHENHGR